jgi:hypothetical protein
MAIGRDFFATYTAGNLKLFSHTGKQLWSTSRYEFSPGQAQAAKRPGSGSSVGPGDWLEWVIDGDSYPPGALLSAASVELSGDSIVVLQAGGSVNVYNRSGRVLALKRMQRANQAGSFPNHTALVPSNAGWLLLSGITASPAPSSTVAEGAFVLSRASLVNGAIGPPLRELRWENPVSRVQTRQNQYYLARPRIPLAPVATLANGTLYFSRGSDFAVELYDEFGRLKRVLEVDTERIPVTEELLAQYSLNVSQTYRTRAAEGDSNAAAWLRDILPLVEQMPTPRLRPVEGSLWVGSDGSIAVRRLDLDPRPHASGDSLIVDVIGADGRYRGRVAFAQPDLSIVHFTGSAFYVSEVAGLITLPPRDMGAEFGRPLGAPPPQASGRGNTRQSTYTPPPIRYQRLLRYNIEQSR